VAINGIDDRVLLIDLGNSSLKWCWLADGVSSARAVPHKDISASAFAPQLWGDVVTPDRVLVASVASPAWRQELEAWMSGAWGVKPEWIVARRSMLGVTNGYSKPEQLGVDRWLTLLAVHHDMRSPACIVDSGTATTLDVIDRTGNHLGGLILPGIGTMNEVLLQRTYIPQMQGASVEGLLGRDTPSAVKLAALLATAGMVDKVLLEIEAELAEKVPLVVTGSGARSLEPRLNQTCIMRPGLVLRGLALVAGYSS